MSDTRAVVTVYPLAVPVIDVGGTMRNVEPVRYEGAVGYSLTDDNVLCVERPSGNCAAWAPGTWARAELTEEPAGPAEPDRPTTPITETADDFARTLGIITPEEEHDA